MCYFNNVGAMVALCTTALQQLGDLGVEMRWSLAPEPCCAYNLYSFSVIFHV